MKLKTLLSLILGVFVFTSCGNKEKSTIDIFGRYPQTKINDALLISSLDRISGDLPTAGDSKKWTSYKYYIDNTNIINFMWYIDVDYDNDGAYDYRGVYFDQYRPFRTDYSSSSSNSFQYSNGYSTGNRYWFKYEPISWKTISSATGDKFAMSTMILDSQEYYYQAVSSSQRTRNDYQGNTGINVYDNNYKYSNLRTFLNTAFYNTAFNSSEKLNIKTTTVKNDASTTDDSSNPYACEDTNDMVFSLSYADVKNWSNDDKKLKATDYAKCQGVYVDSVCGCSPWWLRSPYSLYSINADYMDFDGYLYRSGILYTSAGLAPVLCFK